MSVYRNDLQAEFPGVEGFSPPELPVYACLARSTDPRNPRMQVLPNGDLIASAVPVITLLSYAYDVPINPAPRLSPLPDWTLREKYNIEAKAAANAIPPNLQDSEVRSRIQQMIRGLLADPFRLGVVSQFELRKVSAKRNNL